MAYCSSSWSFALQKRHAYVQSEGINMISCQVHLSSFSLPEFSSRTSASAQGTWKSFMCNFWRKCIIPCIYESIRCIHEQNRCGRIPLKGKFLKKKKINLTKPMSYYNDRLRQWQSVLAFLIGIGCVSNIFPDGTVLLLKYKCTVFYIFIPIISGNIIFCN